MSVFVDALRLIASVGGLSQQFIGVNDPKFTGTEYLSASVTSMGADGLAAGLVPSNMIAARLPRQQGVRFAGMAEVREIRAQGRGKPVGSSMNTQTKRQYRGSNIILLTLSAVELLELTVGFGPPYEGDDLKVGSEQFTTLYEQLKSALPDDNWQGSASHAYADEDTPLLNHAQTLAALDLQLATIVKDQADWVTHTRLAFGVSKDFLIASYFVEQGVEGLPAPGGPAAARIFAIAVCALAGAAVASMLSTLLAFSIENAGKANDLIPQYNTVTTSAVPSGTPLVQTEVLATVKSGVSRFASDMSETSAMPDIATLASLAPEGASAQQRALLRALTGEGETPGDGTPADTPDQTTPTTPAFTMPSLAQVTQMSGQAAQISGHIGQHMNLLNQMTGQLQQLASMAQQGQKAAAPGEEAAAADDVEGAGAAMSTAGAERAPIEVGALGGQQDQEPIPFARIA